MYCDKTDRDEDAVQVAENVLRCTGCGEHVTEDMVPLTDDDVAAALAGDVEP